MKPFFGLLDDALSDELSASVIRALGIEGELAFHADPCRRAYCSSCDLGDCPVRREPFRGRPPLTLEQAVRMLSLVPATLWGFSDRGLIREGMAADLVVFDAATVKDTGTFTAPAQPAAGIELVMVNGQVVWCTGRHTGARPGRVLRHAR